ncbi:MAG: hypothetical protein L6R35_003299 [Caloplaca aegaea]|nr:MAG: hypothetical protein L6R35_003299 [Caloplaca aegaea]
MYLTYFLITFLLSLTSEAQECSPSPIDRCGPSRQSPGTQSTCNATITKLNINGVYTANCYNPFEQSLSIGTCRSDALLDICNRLTDRHVISDRWVWSDVSGCALGFWLPSGDNFSEPAFAPDFNRCMEGIFTPLMDYCSDPAWNTVGSVNVKVLPDSEQNGEAVDPYYPSYIMAPEPLTTYAS